MLNYIIDKTIDPRQISHNFLYNNQGNGTIHILFALNTVVININIHVLYKFYEKSKQYMNFKTAHSTIPKCYKYSLNKHMKSRYKYVILIHRKVNVYN